MTTAETDVLIVGAGVVGTAIARTIARYDLRCVLVDSANDVGAGTTKANTAILHTGFDAAPGSLEARLVSRGGALLREYAAAAGIPVEHTGALLVAWTAEQVAQLPAIVDKAQRNGYRAVRPLTVAQMYAAEPNLGPGALGGIEIPDESIICPWTTPLAFATEAVRSGVRLRLRTTVTAIRPAADSGPAAGSHEVTTDSGRLHCRWLVNAAGLGSDLIDRMVGGGTFTITPRRGELIVFDKLARSLLRHILLPVPTAVSKGVLVAPTVYGNVLLGPTAQDIDDRSDTSTTASGLAGLLDAGKKILPALISEEVTASYAGLRAATEHRDYQIAVDGQRRYAYAGGIRSTGLTASLAIAEHMVALMGQSGLELRELTGPAGAPPLPPAMPYLGQVRDRPYQDAAAIAADPAYGEIVCHCERVTRGEIRDALASDIPPADVSALRRRTRATGGRCQGFYCAARVIKLLASGGASAAAGTAAGGWP